jgi:hypothetical protein
MCPQPPPCRLACASWQAFLGRVPPRPRKIAQLRSPPPHRRCLSHPLHRSHHHRLLMQPHCRLRCRRQHLRVRSALHHLQSLSAPSLRDPGNVTLGVLALDLPTHYQYVCHGETFVHRRTLLEKSDANAGSNAFLSILINDLSLFLCDSVFAGCLSFDFAIATIDCCEQQLVGKV